MTIDPNITFCFEVEWMAELYSSAMPEYKEQFFSWKDLVEVLMGPYSISEKDRLSAFSEWLTPLELPMAERWLKTIEVLRASGILSSDDIQYAFSNSLIESPKNLRLKELMNQYEGSVLEKDWARQVFSLIERVKSQPQDIKPIIFVPFNADPLFLETEKAFRQATQNTKLLETWEIHEFLATPSKPLSPVILNCADPVFLLNTVARQIKTQTDSETKPILNVISFYASLSQILVLRLYLCQNKTHFQDKTGLMYKTGSSISLPQIPEEPNNKVIIIPFHPVVLDSRAAVQHAIMQPYFNDSPTLILNYEELWSLERSGLLIQTAHSKKLRHQMRLTVLNAPPSEKSQVIFEVAGPVDSETTHKTEHSIVDVQATTVAPVRNENYKVLLPRKPLSATAVEAYASCPSKYLFGKRLRLDPQEPGTDRLLPLFVGQITHSTLEMVAKNKLPLTEQNLIEQFDKTLSEESLKTKPSPILTLLAREAFQGYAAKIPVTEDWIQNHFGQIERTETEVHFQFSIAEIPITGTIDRIDYFQGGQWLLYDYKTGSVDFTPGHIIKGVSFQALFYLLAMKAIEPEKQGLGILFYDLKKGELRRGILYKDKISQETIKSITRGHAVEPNVISDMLDEGVKRFLTLAQSIHDSDFTPTPTIESCTRCSFFSLCRKAINYVD